MKQRDQDDEAYFSHPVGFEHTCTCTQSGYSRRAVASDFCVFTVCGHTEKRREVEVGVCVFGISVLTAG